MHLGLPEFDSTNVRNMADHAFHFSAQLELFPWSGAMHWLPDELLFSLASRHHVQAGHGRASKTCEQLFGHRQRGSAHDLPSHIDELVRRTRGELGSALTIIREHTILPFYLPLRSRKAADAAIAAMRGDGIGGLKYRLGLLTSRFRAHHPLKACARCLIEDRIKFRIAYWHVPHQYPGVWICPDHETELLESLVKSTGVGRFLWHLPHQSLLVAANRDRYEGRPPDDERVRLLRLAHAAIALARLPAWFFFDPEKLHQTYRAGLGDKGLCTANGRLHLRDIGPQFLAFAAPFRAVPELAALPTTASQASAQLGRLFYPPRTGTHPLRHLLLILWLFDTWESFWETYLRLDDTAPNAHDLFRDQRPVSGVKEAQDSRVLQFLDLIRHQGRSVTNAACVVGVDPGTGMAWAARAGIATRRRAKILKPDVLVGLLNDLRRGLDKSAIAASHHVPLACISRVLRTEVGLHETWLEARSARTRRMARREWRSAIENSATHGPKAARRLAPAAYAWLYRNDRAWLLEQSRRLPGVVRTNHAAVDWDDRDLCFAVSVAQVCQDLAQATPGARIAIHQVCRQLPHLKPKLGRLDRLPRTRHALECGIGKTSSGHHGRKPR